jgi:hypothetical protein
MGRKKIKTLEPDLEEDEFDEEVAKQIYTSKEYVPPNSSDLVQNHCFLLTRTEGFNLF